MGTTIAAALIDAPHAAVANVGDSRVYLFRAGDLRQITTDDTWINEILSRGSGATDFLNHPMRNVLTQAAGSQREVSVHTFEFELEKGDVLLLSSDGLHGVVQAPQVCEVLASGGAPHGMAERLLESARTEGAPDNVSCILVRYRG